MTFQLLRKNLSPNTFLNIVFVTALCIGRQVCFGWYATISDEFALKDYQVISKLHMGSTERIKRCIGVVQMLVMFAAIWLFAVPTALLSALAWLLFRVHNRLRYSRWSQVFGQYSLSAFILFISFSISFLMVKVRDGFAEGSRSS